MTANKEHIEMTNKLTNLKKICHTYNVKYKHKNQRRLKALTINYERKRI